MRVGRVHRGECEGCQDRAWPLFTNLSTGKVLCGKCCAWVRTQLIAQVREIQRIREGRRCA